MENYNDLGSTMDQTNPENDVVEEQTEKNSADVFLWAALGSLAASLTLTILKRNPVLFVGIGLPAFLLFGIYKLARQTDHDSI